MNLVEVTTAKLVFQVQVYLRLIAECLFVESGPLINE